MNSAVAWNDQGARLAQSGRLPEAMAAFRQAVALAPEYPEAHNNLANLYQMTGALEQAVEGYRTALRLRPEYAEAHRNLASALRRLGRLTESMEALATAVSLNPNYVEAAALLLHQLQQLCEWRSLDRLTAQLIEAVENGSAAVNPFIFLTLPTTLRQQRQCAEQFARRFPVASRPPLAARRDHITLGYLSADFQEHATAHLISELIELHDRTRFRVTGYSYGADDGSAARRRLRSAFDSFVDLEHTAHAEAAARIRADRVDILVDLKGFTTDARPEILALRPAPIQVSYLGYPGTMGSEAIDYILVDSFVVPPDQQRHFTEKLIHLPHCYQVNDRTRAIAPAPTRQQCGLPEDAFVFCCFNATYKIAPAIFQIWLRLLDRVPGSVLWLLESNPQAVENLRREAGSRPLIFAPSLPNPLHLARFAVADLFLDTLPYNAHTLSSDALWGGCPVLTCAGETFASRVAGSLLHSAELPELVTTNLVEYEALALRLARDRGQLSGLRKRLRQNRQSLPLFDTPRFTRDIEAAFEAMLKSA
jgi:predicted O-linked N-acetylglucosamine transferase (SPINDLY family)